MKTYPAAKFLKHLIPGFFLLLACMAGFSQSDLDYYLPEGEYLPEIPEPREVIGHQVGEWHLTHDQLTWYLTGLADASDRVVMREYARSHENRPLFHLVITSPDNHARLEEIRQEHLKLCDPAVSPSLDMADMPVVVTLGYGVHGNESSASNASALVAYYLVASLSEEVQKYLDNMVILLDPCLNPDGFNRHASWINMHQSKVPMRDDNSRGFRETWPGGRTNHYWFDLNRDWILLQHPESRGRVRVFHDWKPNVQTDHHEMESASTFFFQPGVPSRINPFTPQRTTELTRLIGSYHAEALDGINSLYFTEERFDDFYYGKGSSYPDVNGSIGILFEQAGTRGYERDTPRGLLTFPNAIRNQVKVSLSTLQASFDLREELLEHQREFYGGTAGIVAGSVEKAYVFDGKEDPARLSAMLDILLQHRMGVYRLAAPHRTGQRSYDPSSSFIVPVDQPQARMVLSLFQPVTTFTDSLFYDVSTWLLPYAFDLPFDAVTSTGTVRALKGERVTAANLPEGSLRVGPARTGYLFSWSDYHAPSALYAILDHDLVAFTATDPIVNVPSDEREPFGYGSIFVPVEKQPAGEERIREILEQVARESGISIYPVNSALAPGGMDLGSNQLVPVKMPVILLLTGDGIRSQEAGEIWHLLDTRMKVPVVLADVGLLNDMDLRNYTHILMPSGSYRGIGSSGEEAISTWIKQGGTIVAIGSANRWLADRGLADLAFKELKRDSAGLKSYRDLPQEQGAMQITGSIFEAEIDFTHPVGYGLTRNTLPVFRSSTLIAESVFRPYAVPVRYTGDPLLSGYVPSRIYDELRDTPAVVITSRGRGRVISFIDNPNFRGYWYGTQRLFMNAICFGPIISSGSTK